ncbi:MAG: serine/threonine protein kinase [Solobacterium sp.]|nr:serine/threonine protein kinase [Solobacterium sp.]
MSQNGIINGIYQVIRPIGKGGTSEVYLAYHLNLQKYVVVKKIMSGLISQDELRAETDILKNLHHPYLPQVYDFFVYNNEVYTVMDYIDGYDFTSLPCGIRNLSENRIITWMKQMAEVLVYLHSMNPPVIHSDIKPGNVIQNKDGNISLIDFNIAIAENTGGKVKGYSQKYASPEQVQLAQYVINRQEAPFTLDERTDIYSTGALMYHMMSGLEPDALVPSPRLSDMQNLGYSPALCAIVDKCMERDREKRYRSAQKLLNALNNLKKQDSRYKQYVLLKSVSWITSACLIGGGCFCILRGMNEKVHEQFISDFRYVITEADSDIYDYADVRGRARDVLTDSSYSKYLDAQNTAELQRTIGDTYFLAGEYRQAAVNYRDALDTAEDGDLDVYDYISDYVLSVVLADADPNEIDRAIALAEEYGVDDAEMKLILAAKYMKEGDEAAMLENVNALSGSNRTAKAQAYYLAAQYYMNILDFRTASAWLENAIASSDKASYHRALATSYFYMMNESRSDSDNTEYANKARTQYKYLYDNECADLTDRINYGIVLYSLSSCDEAVHVLEECGDEVHALAYLAMSCNEAGKGSEAIDCAKKALKKLNESGKTLDEWIMTNLNNIAYGG